jgi:hypothetical protein
VKQRAYINGQRNRIAERLSSAQWRILFDLRDHGDPFYSRADRAAGSLRALQKIGLVQGEEKLTPLGVEFCAVEWRDS